VVKRKGFLSRTKPPSVKQEEAFPRAGKGFSTNTEKKPYVGSDVAVLFRSF
jgi:hypothetical protein